MQMGKYISLMLHLSSLFPLKILYLLVFTQIVAHYIYHYYSKSCLAAYAFNLVKLDKILAFFNRSLSSICLVCKVVAWSWC